MRRRFHLPLSLLVFIGAASAGTPAEFFCRIPRTSWTQPNPEAWTARFSHDAWPKEPIYLFIRAKAGNPKNGTMVEIRLNSSLVLRRRLGLASDFWRFKRLAVPAASVRSGLNTIEIRGKRLEIEEAFFAGRRFVPVHDFRTEFEVELEAEARETPAEPDKDQNGFKIRGTKGWAWTPEQYLAEIPYLVKAKMNFLMNCYTSLFSSLDPFVNTWWEPLPEAKKRGFEMVVRACRENGITFCFALHPQLFSERPLDLSSSEDFDKLWQHFAWMQSLGVTWFSVSYDDIGVEGLDKSVLGDAHARLVNKLLAKLREKTPLAQMVFCPVYYWGCGETPESRAYLGALGRTLDPEVYVFWTGDGVVTPRITAACAQSYRRIVGHRLIIWDNYPVNDRHPTLHLGPVIGRDPDLPRVAEGYMSNPLCPQNEANRIPLFTCADYALRPAAYDPLRSIGQAIAELAATPPQRRALKNLVELYPGMLIFDRTGTDFNPVLEKFERLLEEPSSRGLATAHLARVESVENQLAEAFPGRFRETRETLRRHIARMKEQLKRAAG